MFSVTLLSNFLAEWGLRRDHRVYVHVPGVDRPRGDAFLHIGDGTDVHLLHYQEVRPHRVHDHHDYPSDDLAYSLLHHVSHASMSHVILLNP